MSADAVSGDASDHVSLVVGIGASAGGLEAFRTFFTAMPADSGMAFVLVQHLDPDHASALTEIVRGCTKMQVRTVEDGAAIGPNQVFVIPPNSVLRLEDGRLRLTRPATTLARRTSVDTFLTSLAEDQGERAVGVILAGYGSDGSVGVESIKEHGGLTLSQAALDRGPKLGMPQSAAGTGWVDHVLPVEDMPACLLEHQGFRSRLGAEAGADRIQAEVADHLGAISAILNSRIGRDFSQYKKNTMMRRVQRRMQVLKLESVPDYLQALRERPEEPELLFREVLIRVTRFFRDPAAFQALAENCLPDLLATGGARDAIRVWVPGCATGEEAYSLAILFKEALALADRPRPIQIFATDIDDQAIAIARAGVYPDTIATEVSAERLERHFHKEGDQYRVSKDLRDMCLFSIHDLVKDPPFSRLDLVSCRNLMIYFNPPLQKRVVQMFHYGLRPGGVVMLGSSEALTAHGPLFSPIDKKHRLSRRLDGLPQTIPVPPARTRPPAATVPFPAAIDSDGDPAVARALQQFTPAYVIVDEHHAVRRFSGPVARFLEPATGPASFDLSRLVHADLRVPLRAAVKKARSGGVRVVDPGVEFKVGDRVHAVNLVVEPLGRSNEEADLILVAFQDAPNRRPPDAALLVSGLSITQEQLQTVTEELETANEELQSSNEEYQSVNEELQSTNEELETSKEELQSVNEELQAVNAELANRNERLIDLNSDLTNLIDSTSIATLFLDGDLRIKRFTPPLLDLFNVRAGDEGRPITDIVSHLVRDGLERDVRQVIRTLVPVEREVAVIAGDRSYQMIIRPYRDTGNVINGVVITFVDVTGRKEAETNRARLAAIIDSTDDAILSKDINGLITSWNSSAERLFGYAADEAIGQPIAMLTPPNWKDEDDVILSHLGNDAEVDHLETVRRGKNGGMVEASLTVSPIRNGDGTVIGASTIYRDISRQKRDQRHAALLMAELDHRVKNILAVVSSVVGRTVRSAATPQEMADAIEGRIAAIAKAHSQLTDTGIAGASLAGLFRTELAPYRIDRVVISGPDVSLTLRAGVALSLTIHELTTNAVKYGCLSSTDGRLDVRWDVSGGDAPVLRIDWTEAGGPAVSPPKRRGFGSTLIERALTHELDARVKQEFEPSGLVCSIELPLTEEVGRLAGDLAEEAPA